MPSREIWTALVLHVPHLKAPMLFPFRTAVLALESGNLHLTRRGVTAGTCGPHTVATVVSGHDVAIGIAGVLGGDAVAALSGLHVLRRFFSSACLLVCS